jgi:predicted transcriptional regulator
MLSPVFQALQSICHILGMHPSDVAKRLGITTTTLYMYVNGDGSVKAAGQAILNQSSE